MRSAVINKSKAEWIKIHVFFSYCCLHTGAFVRGTSIFGLPTMMNVCMNHVDLCIPRDQRTPMRKNPINSCEREGYREPASRSWA